MKAIDEFIEENGLMWNGEKAIACKASDLTALIEDACREQREADLESLKHLEMYWRIESIIEDTPFITNKPESDERNNRIQKGNSRSVGSSNELCSWIN